MIEALTTAAIVKLAFEAAIQTGAGNLTEEAISKAKRLWQKIEEKFKGNPIVEEVLKDAEEKRSLEILEQVLVPLLKVAMEKDPKFNQEVQNIAQQINQEIKGNLGQKNITVENVQASDNATATGNIEVQGNVESIGGTHHYQKK